MQGQNGHGLNSTTQSETDLGFDKTFQELMEIVKKLESGDIELEDSIRLFEQGVSRVRICEKILASADQKIETLMQPGGA